VCLWCLWHLVGRYCNGCITLKEVGSACVCRIVWDVDHIPHSLRQLMEEDEKVNDFIIRGRKVIKQLTDE